MIFIKSKYSSFSFLLAITIILIGCKKDTLLQDDELSLQKRDYNGNQLKIDGYYYQKKDDNFYTMYCFYKNGLVLYLGGGFSVNQVKELEDRIADGSFYEDAKRFKDYWGVFKIEENRIVFEKWYPSSGGGKPAFTREGNVLNDTTFMIAESYRLINGGKTEQKTTNETYHFKEFNPKPDSTNSFVQ